MYQLRIKKDAFVRLKDGEGNLIREDVMPEPIYIPAGLTVEARKCEIEGCTCTVLAIWVKEGALLVDGEDVEIVPPQDSCDVLRMKKQSGN